MLHSNVDHLIHFSSVSGQEEETLFYQTDTYVNRRAKKYIYQSDPYVGHCARRCRHPLILWEWHSLLGVYHNPHSSSGG